MPVTPVFFLPEKKNSSRENFQFSVREVLKLPEKKSRKLPEKKKMFLRKKCKILPEKIKKVPEKKSGPKYLIWIFSSYFCDCGGLMLWLFFLNLFNAFVKTVLSLFWPNFVRACGELTYIMILAKLSSCLQLVDLYTYHFGYILLLPVSESS